MRAPLRILIVEDEPLARDRLKRLLANVDDIEIIGEATNGREALTLIESSDPDVVLLDIQMPDLDGLRVLEALDDPPAIIFSTAHDRYALKAFDLEAVDYLLKPYSSERLGRAIERARRLLSGGSEIDSDQAKPMRIPVERGASVEFVPIDEIVLFSVIDGFVFLHRQDGNRYLCNKTLREFEDTLPGNRFFRINRQAIASLGVIESYKPNREGGLIVRLKGGIEQTVSRRRVRHLRARLGLA